MVLSVGAVLSPLGSESVAVGIVAWGREGTVGRVVSWVAVGMGMMEGRVDSSVIMPPGWVLTLAAQPQPVNRADISARARVMLNIFFISYLLSEC